MENSYLKKQNRIKKEVAISNSFVKTAISDFNSARILLKNKQYSTSLYHSQQAVEKILKAMLALKGRFIYKHEVIAEFCNVFRRIIPQDFIKLVENRGFKIEQEGSSLRYPDFSGEVIFNPVEEFDKEDAKEGFRTAKEIISMAKKEIVKIKKNLS
jgi:HEPN domain-containing protein